MPGGGERYILQLMDSIATILLALFSGALGWFVANFVGKPILRFFELREEIDKQLGFFGNIRSAASVESIPEGILYPGQSEKLADAETS
jgi:hypothetical protein